MWNGRKQRLSYAYCRCKPSRSEQWSLRIPLWYKLITSVSHILKLDRIASSLSRSTIVREAQILILKYRFWLKLVPVICIFLTFLSIGYFNYNKKNTRQSLLKLFENMQLFGMFTSHKKITKLIKVWFLISVTYGSTRERRFGRTWDSSDSRVFLLLSSFHSCYYKVMETPKAF